MCRFIAPFAGQLRQSFLVSPLTPGRRRITRLFFGLAHAGLAGGGDVLGVGFLEDFLGGFHFVGIVRMDGDQDVAFPYLPFIAFGLVFGNAQADESAGHTANSTTDRRATQCGNNWPGSYEWTGSRNGESANAGKPAQRTAQHGPTACAGSGTFGRFGGFFVRKVAGPLFIGEQG